MGFELMLDERAAEGKAALADGAVEGQRGGGAELTVNSEAHWMLKSGTARAEVLFVGKLQPRVNKIAHDSDILSFRESHLDPVRRQRVTSQRCVGDEAAAAVRARVRQEGAVVIRFVL